MNNKQVPEEIITDAFQISEDLKNGNIHNNRQFVQLSHVKELVASLPAEPSTPETKDKPATGSGGGGEGIVNATVIVDKDLPENTKEALLEMIGKASEMVSMKELIKKHLGWHPTDSYMPSAKHFVETGVVSGNLYLAIEKIAKEYATLRQPTGTVYVRVAEKTDWVLGYYYRDAENKEMLMGECFLKPIQFVPEREGVKRLGALTDAEKLEVAKILGGASHISEENQIIQVDELLKNRYSGQTNIPGIGWYRAWKYLESCGYEIDGLNV